MHGWGLLGLFYLGAVAPLAMFDKPEESAAVVALTTALAIGAKLAWNIIDRRLPKTNGNGDVQRVCFMGLGAADRLMDSMRAHDEKMERMLETLTEIAQNDLTTSSEISKSLAVLAENVRRRH